MARHGLNDWKFGKRVLFVEEHLSEFTRLEQRHCEAAKAWDRVQSTGKLYLDFEGSALEYKAAEFDLLVFLAAKELTERIIVNSTDDAQIKEMKRQLQLAMNAPRLSSDHPNQAKLAAARLRNLHMDLAIGRRVNEGNLHLWESPEAFALSGWRKEEAK